MSDTEVKDATEPRLEDWVAFDDGYKDVQRQYPMLGLASAEWAGVNLRRNFGTQLVERGVLLKAFNHKWLVHRERFGPVLFALIAQTRADVLERARARQASTSTGAAL